MILLSSKAEAKGFVPRAPQLFSAVAGTLLKGFEMEKKKISEFLASLGDSSDAIALSLKNLGVQGKVGDSRSCPISVACNKYAKGWGNVLTTGNGYLTWGDPQITDPVLDPAVQRNVTEFVHNFDARKYPELIYQEEE